MRMPEAWQSSQDTFIATAVVGAVHKIAFLAWQQSGNKDCVVQSGRGSAFAQI